MGLQDLDTTEWLNSNKIKAYGENGQTSSAQVSFLQWHTCSLSALTNVAALAIGSGDVAHATEELNVLFYFIAIQIATYS